MFKKVAIGRKRMGVGVFRGVSTSDYICARVKLNFKVHNTIPGNFTICVSHSWGAWQWGWEKNCFFLHEVYEVKVDKMCQGVNGRYIEVEDETCWINIQDPYTKRGKHCHWQRQWGTSNLLNKNCTQITYKYTRGYKDMCQWHKEKLNMVTIYRV
jgi:hypothetical protein